ncbi:MAG: metal-dependent hydrolase [Nanoarchaeota archaeon]|nr:metal-dependent hydrolase [Nanoarchaeota archaeon]
MLFYTHLAFSFLIGLVILDFFPIKNKLLFFSLLALFTSLPDIDSSKSKIGKKLGFFSKMINFIFGHRLFFHSFLFIIPIYISLSFFSDDIFAIAFLLGTSSHLVLDALTPEGIVPFYPLKYRVKGIIKIGRILEKLLFVLITALIIIRLSTGHTQFFNIF